MQLSKSMLALAALTLVGAMQTASATITFGTGNQQYTNVNIVADTDAMSITGDIGNTGITMTFENMIGPDGSTQVSMHGQHGVAFIESTADSVSGVAHTGFSSLTLLPQAGYGFTAGDFALDELNGQPNGTVSFLGTDQFGVSTQQSFAIVANGQNQYQFITGDGELVPSIVIYVPTPALLQDLKQLSVNVAAIPEPSTYAMFSVGLLGLGFWRRRQSRSTET
jgi:hypothetical protein